MFKAVLEANLEAVMKKDDSGMTPLHYALTNKVANTSVIACLVAAHVGLRGTANWEASETVDVDLKVVREMKQRPVHAAAVKSLLDGSTPDALFQWLVEREKTRLGPIFAALQRDKARRADRATRENCVNSC